MFPSVASDHPAGISNAAKLDPIGGKRKQRKRKQKTACLFAVYPGHFHAIRENAAPRHKLNHRKKGDHPRSPCHRRNGNKALFSHGPGRTEERTIEKENRKRLFFQYGIDYIIADESKTEQETKRNMVLYLNGREITAARASSEGIRNRKSNLPPDKEKLRRNRDSTATTAGRTAPASPEPPAQTSTSENSKASPRDRYTEIL